MKYNSPHCTLHCLFTFIFQFLEIFKLSHLESDDCRWEDVCSALYLYENQGGRLWKHWQNITDFPNKPHQLIVNIPQCVEYVSLTWIPSRSVQFFHSIWDFVNYFKLITILSCFTRNVCHWLRLISSVPCFCLPSNQLRCNQSGKPRAKCETDWTKHLCGNIMQWWWWERRWC